MSEQWTCLSSGQTIISTIVQSKLLEMRLQWSHTKGSLVYRLLLVLIVE